MPAVAVPQRRAAVADGPPDLIAEIRDLYCFLGGVGCGRLPQGKPDQEPDFEHTDRRLKLHTQLTPQENSRAESVDDITNAPADRERIIA